MGTYLIRRQRKGDAKDKGSFAFRIAVPGDLRGRFKSSSGKPLTHIVEGLGTDSEREASRLADRRKVHWHTVFQRARQESPITLAEINDAAR